MRLLIRLGRGHDLKELKELPVVGHGIFGPRLDDDVEGRLADLASLLKGHIPAQEFMRGHAGASAKLQPPP